MVGQEVTRDGRLDQCDIYRRVGCGGDGGVDESKRDMG